MSTLRESVSVRDENFLLFLFVLGKFIRAYGCYQVGCEGAWNLCLDSSHTQISEGEVDKVTKRELKIMKIGF